MEHITPDHNYSSNIIAVTAEHHHHISQLAPKLRVQNHTINPKHHLVNPQSTQDNCACIRPHELFD